MKKLAAFLLTAMLIFSFSFSALAATEGTPISSLNDLKNLEGKSGKFYLIRDITVSSSSSFSPIEGFNGTLDGNGKKISGLKIKADDEKVVGLFASLDGSAIVKNLTLEKVNIECVSDVKGGYFYVGAIAGENGGIIRNCRVSGTITVNTPASTVHVGGITGSNQKQIKYLENYININAVGSAVYAGGIVGEYTKNSVGALEQCINYGSINAVGKKSTSYGGGIASRSGWTINNCANFGSVHVESDVDSFAAGIAGSLTDSDDVITKCFSSGKISCNAASKQFWDAVVAAEDKYPTTINCFYEEGSVAGKSTAQVTTAKALSNAETTIKASFTAFDFDVIWKISDGKLGLQKVTAQKPAVTVPPTQDSSSSSSTQGTTSSSTQGTASGSTQGTASDTTSGGEYIPPQDLNSSVVGDPSDLNNKPTQQDDFAPKKALPIWLFVILAVAATACVCVFLYKYNKKN